MNTNTINGILRALVPAAVAFFSLKFGKDLSGLASPEFLTSVSTVIAAIWSVASNKTPAAPTA